MDPGHLELDTSLKRFRDVAGGAVSKSDVAAFAFAVLDFQA